MSAPDPRAAWRKSTRSTGQGNCVEAAPSVGVVAVRDSKNPSGGQLHVSVEAWRKFTTRIR